MADDIRMMFDEDYVFDVGRTIDHIEKTSTSGLVDTYTIYYTDGVTGTFTVTNGQDGADGETPTFEVSQITGGHRLTITLGEHVETVDLMDGATGQTGQTGPQGPTGPTGQRGSLYLQINTNPSTYTTPVGDIVPAYRISKATVISESGISTIYVGDVLERAYYLYPIAYIDDDYLYSTGRANIRGTQGEQGYTPQKGTDYWTAQDQEDIVQDVLAALPTWQGGSY